MFDLDSLMEKFPQANDGKQCLDKCGRYQLDTLYLDDDAIRALGSDSSVE